MDWEDDLSLNEKIKEKICTIDPNRWWGDDFDVRFYLISEIKKIRKKNILDVGGGIGIISSEIHSDNNRINLDLSNEDLKKCLKENGHEIECVCGSMTNLPFKNDSFDVIIAANILEVAKEIDIEKDGKLPTVSKTIKESTSALKTKGILFITTPNNEYYKTIKLTYSELFNSLSEFFPNPKIYFYNTYAKIGKNRKTNMANVVPKILNKFTNAEEISKKLLKDKNPKNYSVSFFAKLRK